MAPKLVAQPGADLAAQGGPVEGEGIGLLL
jgi:hypothetical protein